MAMHEPSAGIAGHFHIAELTPGISGGELAPSMRCTLTMNPVPFVAHDFSD